ncbi:MAG: hypothetical protein VZS44_10145 [Bacilli bacterium]|nr:hypothetical protein [Bacilli bacterium]
MGVLKADVFNAGGNCLLYYGQFEDGLYFVISENQLFILDTNYLEVFEDNYYIKTGGITTKWEKEHTLEMYELRNASNDIVEMVEDIFKKLKETHSSIYDWNTLCNIELFRDGR